MLSIHFPSNIPIITLRVLLQAPFSSVDAITWVTLDFHFFDTEIPEIVSNSETISCSCKSMKNERQTYKFMYPQDRTNEPLYSDLLTLSESVRAEQVRTHFLENPEEPQHVEVPRSCLTATLLCWALDCLEKKENRHTWEWCFRIETLSSCESLELCQGLLT